MENKKVWIVTKYYTVSCYRTKESTKIMVCSDKDTAINYATEQIKNIYQMNMIKVIILDLNQTLNGIDYNL